MITEEGLMFESMSDLLKQIALGEDSVLEQKTIEFSEKTQS